MKNDVAAGDTIILEYDLDAPPEKVWRALSEPDLAKQWLVPDDVDCRVIEANPERLLRCAWRSRGDERDVAGHRLDTVVSFELSERDRGGTHLRIVHEGFAMTVHAANDNKAPMMRVA